MNYKYIVTLLISALLLVIAWISFNVYHNSVELTTPEDLKNEILPINPNFDQSTIDKLKSRIKISPINNISPPSSPSVTINIIPQISNIPESSESAPIASPGGEIIQ